MQNCALFEYSDLCISAALPFVMMLPLVTTQQ